jgi:hypothetical protein
VVRLPCEKVQGPLQLWQARHFVEKLRSNEGWKIEIRLKKGSEITRSHGGFFKTGTPAFCSECIGFLGSM